MIAKDPFSYIILLASSALFATGYIFARAVDPAAGMDMFVTQAMLASALLLSAAGRAKKPLRPGSLWPTLLNGALTPVVVFLVLEGSRVITPSLAAIIVISNALLIAVFAWRLGRKRFTAPQAAALATGFLGVVWISVERGALGGKLYGVAALVAASVLIAVITVAIEKPVMESGGMVVTRWSFWTAFIVAAVIVAATKGIRFHSPGQTGFAVLLGVFGMGVPVLLFNVGMGRVGAADAAAFKLLIPIFALIYAAVLLGEIPTPGSAMAGLVVIASVGAYQHFNSRGTGAPAGDSRGITAGGF